MANSPVDRDPKYMYDMWGTVRLVTDYIPEQKNDPQIIQEIMHDDLNKNRRVLID